MSPSVTATLRRVLWIWLAWTMAGLFYITQDFVPRLYRSESIPWQPVAIGWMAAMYVCAAFTPMILLLGRRWPLERGRRWPHVALHCGFASIFSIVSQSIEAPVLMALGVFPAVLARGSFMATTAALVVTGFHGGVIRYWVVVGLHAIVRSHQQAREREREALELRVRSSELGGQLTEARLHALKTQLQPHFLFNTLGAIMVLVQQRKTREAEAMIGRLSDLLRVTLDEVHTHEVPLWRELEFLRLYLSIEQIRFQDRLAILVDAGPDVRDGLVPHMVLQPIVENAVRHGLGQSEDRVTIEVKAVNESGRLVLVVADDGPGSSSLPLDGRGIGLRNIRTRLQHLYGARATLIVENRLPHGVRVTLTVPWHEGGVEEAACN